MVYIAINHVFIFYFILLWLFLVLTLLVCRVYTVLEKWETPDWEMTRGGRQRHWPNLQIPKISIQLSNDGMHQDKLD